MQYKGETFVLPVDADIVIEHDIVYETFFILDSCRSEHVSKSLRASSKKAFDFDKAIVNPPIKAEDKQSFIAFATAQMNMPMMVRMIMEFILNLC